MALSYQPEMSNSDAFIFAQRITTAQGNLAQRLCWERCADTMGSFEGADRSDDAGLPSAAKQCIEACVHKFADTAMLVSGETQLWQLQALRQQELGAARRRLAWGAGATFAALGLGCYLLGAGDD
mmetsp:Transcript_70910/g.154045  ORF Transcript_70910/g.154045 Transcript_70910/m.154045 type:complete len:125 (-) Transcript_70910:10-384(-)